MRARAAPARRQGGFLMVVTIWLLAAVAIAAAYFAARTQQALQAAQMRQQINEATVAVEGARAELLFRAAVQPLTLQGLGRAPQEIRLDGRPYRESGTDVRLQDAAGLLGLNQFADEAMSRLIGQFGVPVERASVLIDTLRDYVDEDNLKRLNGGEEAEYRTAGREGGPRNAPLLSATELRQVLVWPDAPGLWKSPRLLDLVTVEEVRSINLNSAPAEVLATLPRVGPEGARAIIARREIEPVTPAWLDRMLGTSLDGLISPVSPFPSQSLRVDQATATLPWGVRYTVAVTPRGALSPWRISQFQRTQKAASATAPVSGPPALDIPDVRPFPPRPATSGAITLALPG
jgi:general secretion pathway protein K